MDKTWLVFESGNSYSITCSLYPLPKGHPRPVDAYGITGMDGDFDFAARRAAEAVYSCIVRKGIKSPPVYIGFDLTERKKADIQVSGRSAGLAFAVAFAKKYLEINPGPVAATGVINANGKIGRVKGIEQKLKAAVKMLPIKSWILYPEENKSEITQELKTRLRDKQFRIFAVSRMDQVMDLLFPEKFKKGSHKKPAVNRLRAALLVFLLLGILAGGYYLKKRNDTATSSPVAIEAPVTTGQVAKQVETPEPEQVQVQVQEEELVEEGQTDDEIKAEALSDAGEKEDVVKEGNVEDQLQVGKKVVKQEKTDTLDKGFE